VGSKMDKNAIEKEDDMAENKNQEQQAKESLTVSSELESVNRRKLFKSFSYWFMIAVLSLAIVILILSFVLEIFPAFVPVATANEMLSILINVDGILLGFIGIIFAQLLSSLMDQQNVLYQRTLEKPKEAYEIEKTLSFMDVRKNGLSLITIVTFGSLIGSIFLSMATIAKNSNLPSTSNSITGVSSTILYPTYNFLFGPLLYTIVAVILLTLALTLLPMRPPLCKIDKDNQLKPKPRPKKTLVK